MKSFPSLLRLLLVVGLCVVVDGHNYLRGGDDSRKLSVRRYRMRPRMMMMMRRKKRDPTPPPQAETLPPRRKRDTTPGRFQDGFVRDSTRSPQNETLPPQDEPCKRPYYDTTPGRFQDTDNLFERAKSLQMLQVNMTGPAEAESDQEIAFLITVRNVEDCFTATNVLVIDELPSEGTFVSSDPEGVIIDSTLTVKLHKIAPGKTKQVVLLWRTPSFQTDLVNHACADASNGQETPDCDALVHVHGPPTLEPIDAAETMVRRAMADMPNSRALLEALDNGLISQTIMSSMDEQSKCGVVPGAVAITSDLFVPQDSNLLTIKGAFSPSEGTAPQDVQLTLFGLDDPKGSVSLNANGEFEIVLSDPLPGIPPYFLLFTFTACSDERTRRLATNTEGSNLVSILYVENQNVIQSGKITATLTWDDDYSDVDLHILEPGDKHHVYYGNKVGTNGAYLDRDDTDGRGPEHFFAVTPLEGVYMFYVNMYNRHHPDPMVEPVAVTWTLSAKIGTTVVWIEKGTFDQPRDFYNDDDTAFDRMLGPFFLDPSDSTGDLEFSDPLAFMSLELMDATVGSENSPKPPLAAADWFPFGGTSESDSKWLFEWQKFRERRRQVDVDRESLYEKRMNTEGIQYLNTDFGLSGSILEYYQDEDLQAIVDDCARYSDLAKAVCAGKAVKSFMETHNEGLSVFWKKFFEVDDHKFVCRHHAFAHGAALSALGLNDWRFLRTSGIPRHNTPDETPGHLWLGLVLDKKLYIMDAYNKIYIQHGIDEKKFVNVGEATIATAEEHVDNDLLALTLTPASTWKRGAVWSSNVVKTRDSVVGTSKSFTIEFGAYFGADDSAGDGIVFALQSQDSTAIGEVGGHFLAYGKTLAQRNNGISDSFAVEFDTFSYPADGPDGDPSRQELAVDHITVWKNGNMTDPVAGPVPAGDVGSNIDSGKWHQVRIEYDSETTTLYVYMDSNYHGDMTNSSLWFASEIWDPTLRLEANVNSSIEDLGDEVYWGFTSATGNSISEHKIVLKESLQYGLYGDNEYSRLKHDWDELFEVP